MFISALSSWCTHNALLILILKYAGMHSLLQETHLKWWICKCPPPRSHTTIYSIYMLGLCLHVYVVFNLTSFNPHNASSHIALGHTQYSDFDFFPVSRLFFPHFTPTKTRSLPTVLKSYPELNLLRAHRAKMCLFQQMSRESDTSAEAHQSEIHLSPATSHFPDWK